MAGSVVARLGASVGLVIILVAGALLAGGSVAAVLLATVDDTPATEQAAIESADVELVRCGQNLGRMAADLRVTNSSAAPSDYFIDLEFVRRGAPEVLEVVSVVIEGVEPGAARREPVLSTTPPPARFDCRVGDVDRLAS